MSFSGHNHNIVMPSLFILIIVLIIFMPTLTSNAVCLIPFMAGLCHLCNIAVLVITLHSLDGVVMPYLGNYIKL